MKKTSTAKKEKELAEDYDIFSLKELMLKQKRGRTSEKDLDEINSKISKIFTSVYSF